MKILFPFVLVIVTIISCNDDIEPITPTTPITSQQSQVQLEVYTYQCKTIRCNEEIPLSGIVVEIYNSEEDAIAGRDILRSNASDNSGIVILPNINSGIIYIKIETEEFGTYIARERITANAVKVFQNVRFIGGYSYNENDELQLNQRHISLSNPAVGQKSKYVYHINYQHISYTPLEYTDVELNVKIIDQIDVNRFIIEEEIDTLLGGLGSPIYPDREIVTSIWRFENDSLHVESYDDNYFGSFAWNVSGDWIINEANGYSFSLKRPSINRINMTDVVPARFGWWGVGFAEDYILFEQEYSDLITDLISYESFDGPLKLRVYNLKDGLIRSLDFYSGMSQSTQGFDLVLE